MNADHIIAGFLAGAAVVGALAWLVERQLDRRAAAARRARRIDQALEVAGHCDRCTRYLGVCLVAVTHPATRARHLQLVCQGCADAGVAKGTLVVISRKARKAP